MDERHTTNTPKKTGRVSLVGAGPGDPGLITVRGLQCISQADAIVYDFMVNPVLLSHARPGVALLCAGKRSGYHLMEQDDINSLLASLALDGKDVCRLKGGDPFVFGRGGEEALYLAKIGVPFEVIPGVSSAVAVPAYAGIPVTHRGVASSCHIVTGHEDPEKNGGGVDWDSLAQAQGTLVFLMGFNHVAEIAARLQKGRWAGDTPAAVITNGTLPSQRAVVGSLNNISVRVAQEGLIPPGVLVVGNVVSLRNSTAWFDRRPLFGRTIVVTRPRAQAREIALLLESFGANVVTMPAIVVERLSHTSAMHDAVNGLDRVDWIVFTSANGVDSFFATLTLTDRDMRALAGIRIAAVGPATAARLAKLGLRPDLVPVTFTAASLLKAFVESTNIRGSVFLLPRSEIASTELARGLHAHGAEVIDVAAYRVVGGKSFPEEFLGQLELGKVDSVLFMSASAVRGFSDALPGDRRAALLRRVVAGSIGPATTRALRNAGISVAVTAREASAVGLVDSLVAHFDGGREGSQYGIS